MDYDRQHIAALERIISHMRLSWCGVVWCGVVWCGVVWCGQQHKISSFKRAILSKIKRNSPGIRPGLFTSTHSKMIYEINPG